MSSASRVLEIYERLLRGEKLSTTRLAKSYGVDRRSIKNSIDTINAFLDGKIIYDRAIKKWYLKEQIDMLLNDEEMVTLNIIEQAAKERGEEFYKDTTKLLAKFKQNLYNSIYSHIDTENIDNIKDRLALANSAVIKRQKLKLLYKDKQREVKPLKLANFDGYWYLVVQDSDSRIKSFYFKNILELQIMDECFELDDKKLEKSLNNAINAYFTTDVTPYEIKLFIKGEISSIFKRKPISKSQRVLREYNDNSIEIALYITNDMEIIPILQRYLPYIFVIEDDENAKRIAKKLKENLQKYLEEV